MKLIKPATVKNLAKAYFISMLLLAILVSQPTQIGIAIALLAIQIISTYKPPKTNLDLTLVTSSLIFAPLAFTALAGNVYSVLLMIPAILLLDQSLKENASTQFSKPTKNARTPTEVLKALATGLFLTFAASVIVGNITLMLTVIILSTYLTLALGYLYKKIPIKPFTESKTWNRTLVGDKVDDAMQLKTKSNVPIFVSLSGDSWIQAEPSKFELKAKDKTELKLSYTPPLAGPTKLRLQASALDSRGLMQINQIIEPIDLHIIPRAKYAKWLAKKYLEKTASGTNASGFNPTLRSHKAPKKGIEYYSSREYQPGDKWKDLDWKHTCLLGKLIVKEFAGEQGQTAIIVADLTAKNAEESDKLAYNFMMTALTFATESLPTALAVYNQKEVFAALSPMNPREALKKTLQLTEKITIIEPTEKVLQSADMHKIKRTMRQLEQTKTEPPQKIINALRLDYETNLNAAFDHPASKALTKITKNTPPPATITVISSPSNNENALNITLEKLKEKGYTTILIKT
jgi:hypothetical protein